MKVLAPLSATMGSMVRCALPLVVLTLTAPGIALAKGGERTACVAAAKSAAQLVADHKLVEAREPLRSCAAPECTAARRTDCQRLAAQVDAAMPTIVFRATDANGQALGAVKVTVDGQPLADRLDGAALAVDPGEHTFTFGAEGLPPVSRTLTLTEGQKGRQETIALAPAASPVAPAAPAPEAEPGPSPPPPAAGPPTSPRGVVTGALGFAGITGVALGGVFGFLTISARDQERADCGSATSCKNHGQAVSDRATALSDGTVSTVGFFAGGLLLAGAAVYSFVLGRSPHDEPTAMGAFIAPSIAPGAGGVSLTGAF